MKKIYQKEPNCLECCIASIFEKNLEEVPEFGDDESWLNHLNTWLEQFNLYAMIIDVRTTDKHSLADMQGYHLIYGFIDREEDIPHVVVGKDGKMVHDPHPSNSGLKTKCNYIIFVAKLTGDKNENFLP